MDERLKRVISGYTHQDYTHVVEYAKFCKQIATGEGYGQLVVNYKNRESDAQKEQRVKITQVRTKHVINAVVGSFEQAYRHEKLKLEVLHDDDSKRTDVISHLPKYGNDGEGVLAWVEQAALYYNTTDPNAFYWVKEKIKDEVSSFSPYMFSSAEVKDFNIYKGDVEWAVCQLAHTVSFYNDETKLNSSKTIDIFYYFNDNELHTVIEINNDIVKYSEFYDQFINAMGEAPPQEKHNNKSYLIIESKDELKYNPINRVGYNLDPITNGRTYVSLWDDGSELCKILVNDGSVFDVSKALHGFPKAIQYYTPCNFQDTKTSRICKGGTMYPGGEKCLSCHGTGKDVHISEQDVVLIRIPTEEQPYVVSPKDLIAYADQPFQFMEMQKKLVDEASGNIEAAVFGVQLSNNPNVADTATAVINYFDKAQNAIYKFTKSPSKMYKFTIRSFADYLDYDDVSTDILYTNKYNLESEEYLLDLLKKAIDAQAPPEVLESLYKRLALKQNRSGDSTASVYEVMRKFTPFAGLDKELKAQLVLSLPFSDIQRALLVNFTEITGSIISKHPTFLMDTYDAQKALVNKLAKEYADASVKSNSVRGIADVTNDLNK